MDVEPPFVHGEAGERSAQIINVELGKGLAVVAICAALCGIATIASIVSGVVAWNASTDSQITLNHVKTLEAEQKVMQERLEDVRNERR